MRACTDASRAAEIGKILGERGLDATVQPIEDVSDVSEFDAYVVGSAVYAGHWMGEVVHMVGAADGDYRDRNGVGAWANAIAESLTAAAGAESTWSASIASSLQHTVTNTMRYLVSPARRRAFR